MKIVKGNWILITEAKSERAVQRTHTSGPLLVPSGDNAIHQIINHSSVEDVVGLILLQLIHSVVIYWLNWVILPLNNQGLGDIHTSVQNKSAFSDPNLKEKYNSLLFFSPLIFYEM